MRILLILFLFFSCHFIFSQDYELVGLIDNKIVTIDQTNGETTLLLEIENIPNGTGLRDLVYQESKQEFYTIANPTNNPYIAKISLSGKFDTLKILETEFAKIYTVEAISLYNEEIYFSASLNGGPEDNDPYAESLLKVNAENEIEFLTEINTEKPFPDIDALSVTEDRIFIFDGAPPGQNFLEFYEMENSNLETISQPNNIYTSTYMPISDFCYFNNELLFVVQKSLYLFDTSIKKVIDINANDFNSNKNFNGLTQYPSCPLPSTDLEEEIKVCNQDFIILDVENPNSSYLWSNGSTNSTLIVTESGEYEVEITNACGSRKFKTEVLFQYPPQEIDIQVEAKSCVSYSLQSKNYNKNYTYFWQENNEDSVFNATESGWYRLTAQNECGSKTDSVYVEIEDFSDISLPNIITPNGDKKNDKFVIDERLQNATISIYNRYGKLVYQNPRYLNDWDSGNLNSGNYFYQITLECGDTFKGWIAVRK